MIWKAPALAITVQVLSMCLYPLTTLINPFYFSYRNTLIPSHVALKAQAQPDLYVKFAPNLKSIFCSSGSNFSFLLKATRVFLEV